MPAVTIISGHARTGLKISISTNRSDESKYEIFGSNCHQFLLYGAGQKINKDEIQ